MRKVIGIGETILDIIFEGNQPSAAVPGGSVFNGIVSLGRAGVNVSFISETGNDRVGNIILQFMRENNIPTDHVNVFPDGKSPVSLAFLNEHSDAEYIFYKDYPKQRLDVLFPEIHEDDIVIVGSYYALNPVLRDKILELLETAVSQMTDGDYEACITTFESIDTVGFSDDDLAKYNSLKAELYPKAADAYYTKGKSDFLSKNMTEAKTDLETALKYASNENFVDDIYYYLGQIAEGEKDTASAKKYYNKIISDYPDSNQIGNARNALEGLKE